MCMSVFLMAALFSKKHATGTKLRAGTKKLTLPLPTHPLPLTPSHSPPPTHPLPLTPSHSPPPTHPLPTFPHILLTAGALLRSPAFFSWKRKGNVRYVGFIVVYTLFSHLSFLGTGTRWCSFDDKGFRHVLHNP